jgi:hypothetical protein
MAAYVVPRDIWYIIPVKVAAAVRSGYLLLSPHREDTKYNAYKEAWHLLCGKKKARSAASPSIPAENEASGSPPIADQPEDAEGSREDHTNTKTNCIATRSCCCPTTLPA